ncbi:hypothetical protein DFJ74DRAFT_665714 [Hyaloraphidium curvatum]|nr:hypothetical protein DFJ74DRAFT_665714 [Hyaloraphidium curvatum]
MRPISMVRQRQISRCDSWVMGALEKRNTLAAIKKAQNRIVASTAAPIRPPHHVRHRTADETTGVHSGLKWTPKPSITIRTKKSPSIHHPFRRGRFPAQDGSQHGQLGSRSLWATSRPLAPDGGAGCSSSPCRFPPPASPPETARSTSTLHRHSRQSWCDRRSFDASHARNSAGRGQHIPMPKSATANDPAAMFFAPKGAPDPAKAGHAASTATTAAHIAGHRATSQRMRPRRVSGR